MENFILTYVHEPFLCLLVLVSVSVGVHRWEDLGCKKTVCEVRLMSGLEVYTRLILSVSASSSSSSGCPDAVHSSCHEPVVVSCSMDGDLSLHSWTLSNVKWEVVFLTTELHTCITPS